MIRNRNTIKEIALKNQLLVSDQLIASDQILISVFDAIIVIAFFIAGLWLGIESETRIIVIVGLTLLIMSVLYSICKNVLFRSIGCILKKSYYTHEQGRKKMPLKLKILSHNMVSISPFIGLLVYRSLPYLFYFTAFIYLLNFVGYYKTNSKRITDSWLKLSVFRKHSGN